MWAMETRAVVEQSPQSTFSGSPHSGCNAEQPLPPRAHCEPPPVSWVKLLVLTSWTKGWEVAGDACCVHLQANIQPVIVAHKSIYSSPEKCGCAGGQCTEFPSIPLSLKAFSCAAHADWKAHGQLCCLERRQSSRCLKKPLGYEDRQREICFLRLPTHLSTRALDGQAKIYSMTLQQAFHCHFLKSNPGNASKQCLQLCSLIE